MCSNTLVWLPSFFLSVFFSVCMCVYSFLFLFLLLLFSSVLTFSIISFRFYHVCFCISAFSCACISSLSVFLFLISSLGQTCFLFCTSVYFFVHILSIFLVCLFLFSLSFPIYLLCLHCLCQPFLRLVQMTKNRWPNLTL